MSDTARADARMRGLHDRSSRGLALSLDEQAELDAWYAEQDRAEEIGPAGATLRSVGPLQAQVDEALAKLQGVTQRIQELAAENDALRSEIAALRAKVAHAQVAHAP